MLIKQQLTLNRWTKSRFICMHRTPVVIGLIYVNKKIDTQFVLNERTN